MQGSTSISFTTRDGRELRGFRIGSRSATVGTLLVAQGNAMLAEHALPAIASFADRGWDVYVFDYRGYGLSDGTPRLKAIVGDYVELARFVAGVTPGKRAFYGTSFGGIVLLKVLAHVGTVDALVIDSSPSLLSDEGCPIDYDPVANVPVDARNVLVITGDLDRVVPPAKSSALVARVTERGGTAVNRTTFAHVFGDRDPAVRAERVKVAADFLDAH